MIKLDMSTSRGFAPLCISRRSCPRSHMKNRGIMKEIIVAVAAIASILETGGCGDNSASHSPNSTPPSLSAGQPAGRSQGCTVIDASDNVGITFVGSYQQGACGEFTDGKWTADGGSISPFNMSGIWVTGPTQRSWAVACAGPPTPTSSSDDKRGIDSVIIYDTVGQPADSSISYLCDQMESDQLEFVSTGAAY